MELGSGLVLPQSIIKVFSPGARPCADPGGYSPESGVVSVPKGLLSQEVGEVGCTSARDSLGDSVTQGKIIYRTFPSETTLL